MRKAIQLIESFELKADAIDALAALKSQDGYLGGRVLYATPEKPSHRVQAFFHDEAPDQMSDAWLPDGCRRVIIPDNLAAALGLSAKK